MNMFFSLKVLIINKQSKNKMYYIFIYYTNRGQNGNEKIYKKFQRRPFIFYFNSMKFLEP